MPQIYKMKDATDSYVIKKDKIWSVPFRVGLIGRTGAGKTSVLGNLLLRKDFYKGIWEGPDIYIFSGSLASDAKLRTVIKELDIPDSNCFPKYSGDILHVIYDEIVNRNEQAKEDGDKPVHSLVILDDVSFTGALARNNAKDDAVFRVCCNGRKELVSLLVTGQKYTQISPTIRENLSGAMIGQSTNKQLDLITADWCFLKDKKHFQDLFRQRTKNSHDYMILNLEQPAVYLDDKFEPIPDLVIEKNMLDKSKEERRVD